MGLRHLGSSTARNLWRQVCVLVSTPADTQQQARISDHHQERLLPDATSSAVPAESSHASHPHHHHHHHQPARREHDSLPSARATGTAWSIMAATRDQAARNVKWVEGLRGIASVMVVVTHICRAFDYALFFPSDGPDTPPRLLQLPILRIPAQGRIGVPIFAFLTGFVCALKPLQLARSPRRRHRRAALAAIARSAFRRPPRLMLPAAAATLASFALAALGGYETAARCDSFWVRFDAPPRQPSLWLHVRQLLGALLTTWTSAHNPYDTHQWPLKHFLVGALQVYVVLLVAVSRMRARARFALHALLLAFWWLDREPDSETFGSLVSLGALVADLSLHAPTQALLARHQRVLARVVAPALALAGLLVGSYPQEHEDWTAWARWLHRAFVDGGGGLVVPAGTNAQRRMSSLAVQLWCVALFLSPAVRGVLSGSVLLWLGRHSFAVYLVHGTILRTVGVWIAYGGWRVEPAQGDEFVRVRSGAAVAAAVVVFVVLTYAAAWAWMVWVDAACARFTLWLEAKVFERDEGEDEDEAEKGFAEVVRTVKGGGGGAGPDGDAAGGGEASGLMLAERQLEEQAGGR